MNLSSVRITSGILNIVDDANTAGRNRIVLESVTLKGGAGAGSLVELRDPDDSLYVTNSSLDYPLEVVAEVLGQRGVDNSGGLIRMEHTSLTAAADPGEGVALVASEHTGKVELTQPAISTPATISLVAGQLRSDLGRREAERTRIIRLVQTTTTTTPADVVSVAERKPLIEQARLLGTGGGREPRAAGE